MHQKSSPKRGPKNASKFTRKSLSEDPVLGAPGVPNRVFKQRPNRLNKYSVDSVRQRGRPGVVFGPFFGYFWVCFGVSPCVYYDFLSKMCISSCVYDDRASRFLRVLGVRFFRIFWKTYCRHSQLLCDDNTFYSLLHKSVQK